MNQRLIRILGGTNVHYPYALESKFPRILDTLMSLWDDETIDAYFTELLVNERGDRSGFPPDVAADIMHLSLVHTSQESPDKSNNIWDVAPESFVNFTPHPETAWTDPEQTIQAEIQKQDFPCTPEGFFAAAEQGNRTAVALFIEAKENTEIRDSRGWTPLMSAAFNGHDEIVSLLLQHHADANALDNGGNSPLHWAAFGDHVSSARRLIQYHAKTDARNHFGWTPLIQATVRNHPEVMRLLIEAGVNLDSAADDGYTALHKACSSGHGELVELLLKQGANPKLLTHEGDTPLKLAIKHKQEEIIALLQN